MGRNCLTSSDMDLTSYARRKVSTERCLSTTLCLTTLEKLMQRCHNARRTSYSDRTQAAVTSQHATIYSTRNAQTASSKLGHTSTHQTKATAGGSAAAGKSSAQVTTITSFTTTTVPSCLQRESFLPTIHGSGTIHQAVRRSVILMDITARMTTSECWSMKV